jgi:hypothetical protein
LCFFFNRFFFQFHLLILSWFKIGFHNLFWFAFYYIIPVSWRGSRVCQVNQVDPDYFFNFLIDFFKFHPLTLNLLKIKLLNLQCFETRPGPAGRPGAGTRPGWWKNSISHDPVWPSGLTGDPAKPGQKPGCNPLTFFFFTKTTPFWIFFKIGIDPADPAKTRWPGQNPEPGPWTGPGSKTLLICFDLLFMVLSWSHDLVYGLIGEPEMTRIDLIYCSLDVY